MAKYKAIWLGLGKTETQAYTLPTLMGATEKELTFL
jgi:hypothetical protein